jgi:hypothetical protein
MRTKARPSVTEHEKVIHVTMPIIAASVVMRIVSVANGCVATRRCEPIAWNKPYGTRSVGCSKTSNASWTNMSDAWSSHRRHPQKPMRQGVSRLIDGYSEGYIDKGEFEPRIRRFKERLQTLESQAQQ